MPHEPERKARRPASAKATARSRRSHDALSGWAKAEARAGAPAWYYYKMAHFGEIGWRDAQRDGGFSLLEVLISFTITLVVMAMVAQTMRQVALIYDAQSRLANRSSTVALALDDMSREIALAGQGLGDGVPVVRPRAGGGLSGDALTLRSNPEVVSAKLQGTLGGEVRDVVVTNPLAFEKDDGVLLSDLAGRSERATILRVGGSSLGFRSSETRDGLLRNTYNSAQGARVMKLREVRYYLEAVEGEPGYMLIKDVEGGNRRGLARYVESLAFEYLDREGKPISIAKVESSSELATIRWTIAYRTGPEETELRKLSTAVTLGARAATVDFEQPGVGFRLSRIFHPIDAPAGVATRIGADWGVILSSGAHPPQDPAYVYTFALQKKFMSAHVDSVTWIEDVRAPVALAFAPESSPLRGSLLVAAWGLRVGHLARVHPDEGGFLSPESEITAFDGTEALGQAGGIAFGVDGALYVTAHEKGAIFRYRFDDSGKPQPAERLFALDGTPGGLAEGADGFLYFVMNHEDKGSVWKLAFDETLSPQEPVRVGPLPGRAVALANDPVGGSMFALVRAPIRDYWILELGRAWLGHSEDEQESEIETPPVMFSLANWLTELEEGTVASRKIPFPKQELPQRLGVLRTEQLDFLDFDSVGSLYTGSMEQNLVLKFELDRPSGLYAVGVSGGVTMDGVNGTARVKIHAWKKTTLGL